MRRVAVLAIASVLALAACSESRQVGDPSLLEGIKETAPASPSPSPAAVKASPTVKRPPKATVAATTSPTRVVRAGSFTLVIRETTRGYEPQVFQVFRGAKVIFRNLDENCPHKSSDTQCRHTWTADDGTWDSGPVPAGGSFIYVADKVGVFNFHDELVPYLQGQMRVLAPQ